MRSVSREVSKCRPAYEARETVTGEHMMFEVILLTLQFNIYYYTQTVHVKLNPGLSFQKQLSTKKSFWPVKQT
jgi:hypothetical protein